MPDGTTKTKLFPSIKESLQMFVTFALVVFGWIIFRATGMKTLTAWMTGIFDSSLFTVPWLINRYYYIPLTISITILLLVEWVSRHCNHGLENIETMQPFKKQWIRIISYALMLLIILYCRGNITEFIYFQF